ncbi:hypothetical protein JM83_0197 [Gillisia sp. Hel_I_86]|uniref:hypothetical protein n=1 Tax=Gillisia sp. Hel_I_86 TaxID=1249981 RepID=UPI00119BB091|nr:hypothetical protein [Gillisia sp. Hel_I_86]TVZ25295.1 hypothetical protein JM83_0197 [Gillisia sp. Hel_I_86]
MLDFIIEHKIYIGLIFELIAAISGSYYLFKTPNVQRDIKYLAWFLWYVFLLDLSGLYALWSFFDDYKTFPFLEDSLFQRNVWLHNWNHLISISFYSFLFIKQLERVTYKRILKFALFIFILLGIFKLTSSNQLFYSYDMTILIVGVLLLIIAIASYYFELLISDQILDFKNNLLFYISVGLLIWHLCVPPIHIYSVYFSVDNIDFIKMHSTILRYSNIFLYGMFSFGFIYCAQIKKLPEITKNRSAR